MSVQIISLEQGLEILNSQGNKFYSVVFEKRTNGLDRKMLCLNKVKGNVRYDLNEKSLKNVYDVQSKAPRMINLLGLKKIKANKKEYVIRQ